MKKQKVTYPFIRAWGRMMGSYQYYIEIQVSAATAAKAPQNAIYENQDGTWATFDGVTNPDTLRYFELNYPHLVQAGV